MRINKFIALLFASLLITGCGDQVWCGENGCGAQRMTSNPSFSTMANFGSMFESLL